MVINSFCFLIFFWSEKVFFFPLFSGCSILGWMILSFSTLNISFHSLLRNLLIALCRYPCICDFFSLATFNLLFLSLILDSFIRMCLREDHFGLNCLDISEPHELGYPNIYTELGSSSHCLNSLCYPFFFSYPSQTLIFCRLLILTLPHKSHRHTSLFFIFFPSLTKQFQMTFLWLHRYFSSGGWSLLLMLCIVFFFISYIVFSAV